MSTFLFPLSAAHCHGGRSTANQIIESFPLLNLQSTIPATSASPLLRHRSSYSDRQPISSPHTHPVTHSPEVPRPRSRTLKQLVGPNLSSGCCRVNILPSNISWGVEDPWKYEARWGHLGASVAQDDFLILQLGQSLYNKHGSDPTKFQCIRQKVREMGRLLLSLRKKYSIFSFEDAVKPNNFFFFCSEIRTFAKEDWWHYSLPLQQRMKRW